MVAPDEHWRSGAVDVEVACGVIRCGEGGDEGGHTRGQLAVLDAPPRPCSEVGVLCALRDGVTTSHPQSGLALIGQSGSTTNDVFLYVAGHSKKCTWENTLQETNCARGAPGVLP